MKVVPSYVSNLISIFKRFSKWCHTSPYPQAVTIASLLFYLLLEIPIKNYMRKQQVLASGVSRSSIENKPFGVVLLNLILKSQGPHYCICCCGVGSMQKNKMLYFLLGRHFCERKLLTKKCYHLYCFYQGNEGLLFI